MEVYIYATILLATSLLQLLPVFSGQYGGAVAWIGTSAVCFILSVGLFLRRSWPEPALFGTAFYFVVSWLAMLASLIIKGWPVRGLLHSTLSLLPGVIMSTFWIGMWLLVRANFKGASNKCILSDRH